MEVPGRRGWAPSGAVGGASSAAPFITRDAFSRGAREG